MVSYEQFEKSINAIKTYKEYEDKLADLGVNIWEREEIANLITTYIDFISMAFNLPGSDSDLYSTDLDYWIYELEFGTDPNELMEDSPDKEAFTTTLKALYNYFCKNNN